VPDLLHLPHHDGGPRCVPAVPTRLDQEVQVRVWVPSAYPVRMLAARVVTDGEPRITLLTPEQFPDPPERGGGAAPLEDPAADDPACRSWNGVTGRWWCGTITLHNPDTRYRFCLVGDGEHSPGYAWLTAAGVVDHDLADATDFRLGLPSAPDWVDDAIVYQIFPDRFARASTSPALTPDTVPDWARLTAWDAEPSTGGEVSEHQLYGGDLDGIVEHLDHIRSLGANTIYLTPVFPAGSAHRYDAESFDEVDPLLGGEQALIRLSRALHARGMRLILDLTTNHTGRTHEWFTRAVADAGSTEAGFYTFIDHPDRYESWLGVPSLPTLDHRDPVLRTRLLEGPDSVVGRYLSGPVRADGWRIDVANMTGRNGDVDLAQEVARTIRRTMDEVRGGDTWLLAEHGHDASGDLAGDGWMGTMNYVGFTRPLWAWLSDPDNDLDWAGLPMPIPHLDGGQIAATLREYNAHMPLSAWRHSQSQLSSHDTPRIRTVVGSREKQLVALAALVGLPGVPTVFMGDEFGAEGRTGEHSRTTMAWDMITDPGAAPAREGEHLDREVFSVTRQLLALRAELPALRRGGIRFLAWDEDLLVVERTHPDGDLLVHLARDAHTPLDLGMQCDRVLYQEGRVHVCAADPADPAAPEVAGGVIRLAADGPGASIIRLVD
jgi:alpha-glucosidase